MTHRPTQNTQNKQRTATSKETNMEQNTKKQENKSSIGTIALVLLGAALTATVVSKIAKKENIATLRDLPKDW